MSKRLRDVKKHVQSTKHHAVDDAVAFFINDYTQKYSANFDETIELVVKLGIDTKQSNQVVKGSVSLPNTLGKVKKVAAIVDNLRIQDAKRAGADFVGGEDLIKKIKEGFSEKQIYTFFEEKYGEWILYDPLFNKNTYFLWLLPLLIFLTGGAIIFKKLIKKQK